METITLKSQKREIFGKKLKQLRRDGRLPANLFGKKIESTSIEVDLKEFSKVFNEVGSTGLVELHLDSSKHPVLISAVQSDPRTDGYLHADFFEVNLKDKITARIPILFTNEAPAEKAGTGTIIQPLNEIEVEALPADLPHEIEVDLSTLVDVGQTIQVKDIKLEGGKVEIKTDPESVIVLVQETKQEAPAEETVEGAESAGPEVINEKPAEEGAESEEKKD